MWRGITDRELFVIGALVLGVIVLLVGTLIVTDGNRGHWKREAQLYKARYEELKTIHYYRYGYLYDMYGANANSKLTPEERARVNSYWANVLSDRIATE